MNLLEISTMVDSRDAARTAIGILGNVISIILFLSPVPTFIKIWKKGSVEQFSPIPYLATLFNCGLWVMYGLPVVQTNSILVLTLNGAGFVIELVYVFLFLRYSSNRKEKLTVLVVMMVEFISIAVLGVAILALVHNIKIRPTIVGSIATVANVAMYASPLSVMKMVIKTRSVEYMPLFLSLASTANSICWSIYALIRFDPFLTASNGMGTVFGLAQLILYATFYRSTKRLILERQSKVEMGSAQTTASGPELQKV